jgi:hypothetical protein
LTTARATLRLTRYDGCGCRRGLDNGGVAVALVAAQASLNLAYTRSTLQIMGYHHADLAMSFPGFEEMSVSNYSELMNALDASRDAILGVADNELTPTPVAISLPAPAPGCPHVLVRPSAADPTARKPPRRCVVGHGSGSVCRGQICPR